jgi:hypothetical protein
LFSRSSCSSFGIRVTARKSVDSTPTHALGKKSFSTTFSTRRTGARKAAEKDKNRDPEAKQLAVATFGDRDESNGGIIKLCGA